MNFVHMCMCMYTYIMCMHVRMMGGVVGRGGEGKGGEGREGRGGEGWRIGGWLGGWVGGGRGGTMYASKFCFYLVSERIE